MSDWYYLDANNQVCGPVRDWLADDSPTHVGWGDRGDVTRNLVTREGGHGVRPCGWERVAFTEVAEGCTVSTVFLGLDHSFMGGPPLVFESLANWGFDYMRPPADPGEGSDPAFVKANELYRLMWERNKDTPVPVEWDMDRYSTWEQAEAGHRAMVVKMQEAIAVVAAKQAVFWSAALAERS